MQALHIGPRERGKTYNSRPDPFLFVLFCLYAPVLSTLAYSQRLLLLFNPPQSARTSQFLLGQIRIVGSQDSRANRVEPVPFLRVYSSQ